MATGYTFYIKRLLSLPPHISAKKILAFVRTSINSKIEKVKVQTFGANINDKEFSAVLQEGIENVIEEFKSKLNVILPEHNSIDFENIFKQNAEEAKKIINYAINLNKMKKLVKTPQKF